MRPVDDFRMIFICTHAVERSNCKGWEKLVCLEATCRLDHTVEPVMLCSYYSMNCDHRPEFAGDGLRGKAQMSGHFCSRWDHAGLGLRYFKSLLAHPAP